MKPKKLFIFLADGVGLRNFAFTKFYALGKSKGYDVVFWNASSFDLSALGYAEGVVLALACGGLRAVTGSRSSRWTTAPAPWSTR